MKLIIDEYPQLRFCRIQKGTKKPFEEKWTEKPYTWEEITKFIGNECYGVLCGYGNLAVIDSDKPELQKHIEKTLPDTFKVKTGSGGVHNYYFIPKIQKKIVLETKLYGTDVSWHWGEVQWKGQQVVGSGSLHPNGKNYEPLNELPIVELSLEQLYSALEPFMKEVQETQEIKTQEKTDFGSDIDSLSVVSIWGTAGLKQHNDEYFGSHPEHGSDTKSNFWLNPSKNTWHCFRHDSGGGPLSAIAVKEGIIDCSEAKRGALRGEKAYDAILKAKEKYGLKDEYKINLQTNPLQTNVPVRQEFTLIWDKDFKDYKETQTDWLIDKLIPNCSIGVWTGKRATYKTFIALEAVYSLATGTPFLGQLKTKKSKVLYLDKENGVTIIKQRADMIKKGKGLIEDCDAGFICFSTLKIDNPKDMLKIESLIQEHKPNIIFIDTYRRAISFDENDAGEVSKLFVDTLRPLAEKYKIAICLIHHDKKSQLGESRDEMDEIRGSSDLANYADWIIKNKRKGVDKSIIIDQVKNRNAPEITPIKVNFETDELTYFKFVYGGEYEPQNKENKCIEVLMIWMTKDNLSSFQTRDAQEVAFTAGIKKSNFFTALTEMEGRGLIKKIGRGEYEINKDRQLFV